MPNNLNLQRNRSRLGGLEVKDGVFSRLDLRFALAQSSRWTNCRFTDVRLSASNFGDATFEGCEFVRCRFDRAILVSRIYRTRFEACDFEEAVFRGADVLGSEFLGGRAHYSDWGSSTLRDCRLDLDFRNARLDFAVTANVDFSGSSLWSASTPWNCAFFVGNTFDERQVSIALSLISYARIPEATQRKLAPLIPGKYAALVRRLIVAER